SEARADGDGSGAPADSAGSLLQAPAAEDAGSGAAARSMSPQTFAFLLSCGAGVLHAVGVALRAAATQRVPWTNMYEFATTSTVGVMLLYLLFSGSRRELRAMGFVVVDAFPLVLLLAPTFWIVPAAALAPRLQNSHWRIIHLGVPL